MRKRDAALAYDGVVAPRQRGDELMRVGEAGGLLDLLKTRAGRSEGDVIAHARGEEKVVLQDDADLGPQRFEREPANVTLVDQHPTLPGVVQAENQTDKG